MKTNNGLNKKQAWDKFKSYVLERDKRQFEAFSEYVSLQNKNVAESESVIVEELEL